MSHPPIFIRPLQVDDLPAAMEIQSAGYPAFLVEDVDAFLSRLETTPSFCLAAIRDGQLAGYLIAHGWARQAPPPLSCRLPRNAPDDILFIHDLSVASVGRGAGIGEQLVMHVFQMAAEYGLREAELIAVEGADVYWSALGFAEGMMSSALAAKVSAYGSKAKWMTRHIADHT